MKKRTNYTKHDKVIAEYLENLRKKIYRKNFTEQDIKNELNKAGITKKDLTNPDISALFEEITGFKIEAVTNTQVKDPGYKRKVNNTPKRDTRLKKIIINDYIYTEFPKALFSLTKKQVQDLIETLCIEGANRGWFNIMNSTPNVTSVGFDCIFMNKLMFGSEDKIYQNNMKFYHPLTNLLKEYFKLYELDEWYEKNRLVWYQDLLLRNSNIKKFTQENKLICLLTEFYDFPLLLKDKDLIYWEKYEDDIYFNGLVTWHTGTGEIFNYGCKGRNTTNNLKTRNLFASDLTLNKDVLENRSYQLKRIDNHLRELGYKISLEEGQFLVPVSITTEKKL